MTVAQTATHRRGIVLQIGWMTSKAADGVRELSILQTELNAAESDVQRLLLRLATGGGDGGLAAAQARRDRLRTAVATYDADAAVSRRYLLRSAVRLATVSVQLDAAVTAQARARIEGIEGVLLEEVETDTAQAAGLLAAREWEHGDIDAAPADPAADDARPVSQEFAGVSRVLEIPPPGDEWVWGTSLSLDLSQFGLEHPAVVFAAGEFYWVVDDAYSVVAAFTVDTNERVG